MTTRATPTPTAHTLLVSILALFTLMPAGVFFKRTSRVFVAVPNMPKTKIPIPISIITKPAQFIIVSLAQLLLITEPIRVNINPAAIAVMLPGKGS
jgi:hypothetical protein